MAKKAIVATKKDAFADALSARREKEIFAGTHVTVGSYIKDGKQLPTLSIHNEPPFEFPLPQKTQVETVLLEFVDNPINRFVQPKHTVLRFTSTKDGWEINRATYQASSASPNPAPNFDVSYSVDLNGHDSFLRYKGLQSITVETKAPTIDATKVKGAVSLGSKAVHPTATKKPAQER